MSNVFKYWLYVDGNFIKSASRDNIGAEPKSTFVSKLHVDTLPLVDTKEDYDDLSDPLKSSFSKDVSFDFYATALDRFEKECICLGSITYFDLYEAQKYDKIDFGDMLRELYYEYKKYTPWYERIEGVV